MVENINGIMANILKKLKSLFSRLIYFHSKDNKSPSNAKTYFMIRVAHKESLSFVVKIKAFQPNYKIVYLKTSCELNDKTIQKSSAVS